MNILHAEPLQAYNSLALEAQAAAMVEVSTDAELAAACAWAQERDTPVVPLGEGSNIVLAGDLDALVIKVAIPGIEVLEYIDEGVRLRVAAGENWHQLVQWTVQENYHGLENLALIPGTVGAAPIQNIGAYGVELASFVTAVNGLSIATGETVCLSRTDCEFGYRDSAFKQGLRDQLVITSVELQLGRLPRVQADYPALAGYLRQAGIADPTPRQVFDAVVAIRRSKLPDPSVEPNAGSFFKNPVVDDSRAADLTARFPGLPVYPQDDGTVKLAAAWMIEFCGWKGYREDNIGVHPDHALVIVNYGNGSGRRLLSLASEIATTVADTFGIELLIEPRIYS